MELKKPSLVRAITLFGSMLVGTSAIAAMPPLVLTGRVQEVDVSRSTIKVLNHTVHSASAHTVVVGQLVNVYGVATRLGGIEDALIESVPAFSNGGNSIFFVGEISAIDKATNVAVVGGVQVALAELVTHAGANAVQVGNVLQLTGEALPTGAVALRSAIMGGSGEHSAIMGGSGERGAIMGGSGERGAIMGGSGERGAIMGGSGERGAIMGGSGERGAIMGGSGDSSK